MFKNLPFLSFLAINFAFWHNCGAFWSFFGWCHAGGNIKQICFLKKVLKVFLATLNC